jgi:hypothetical protein
MEWSSHGFRYVRIDNYPGTAEEARTAVVGLFMHSDVTPHGNLTIDQSTRDGKILAAVHAAVVQTQACNIYSVPTGKERASVDKLPDLQPYA